MQFIKSNKYRIANFLIMVLISIYLIPFIFRMDGNDFNVYLNIIKDDFRINDLFLSNIIIRISYRLFNIYGFGLINSICFSIILLIFNHVFWKKKKYLTYSLMPIILLLNLGVLLQIGSTIKNNMAFTIICIGLIFESYETIILLLIALIHLPSILYYILYLNIKKFNLIYFISTIMILISLYIIILSVKGYALITLNRIIHCTIHAKNIGLNINYNFGKRWNKYIIYNLSIIPFSINKYLKNKDKMILIYLSFLLLPYLPFYAIEFRWRILILSWFPFINLLKYIDEKGYNKIYIISLALFNILQHKLYW